MKKRPPQGRQQEFWLRHLQRHQEIGGSLSAYAKQHDLPISGLYNGKYQLQAKGLWPTSVGCVADSVSVSAKAKLKLTPSMHFAEVVSALPVATSLLSVPAMTLHFANGIRVECSGMNECEFRWFLQCARELA